MECKNPSEWRVTSNLIGGAPWYGVYRLRDKEATDENGNREYAGGYFPTKKEARALADELNKEGKE